MARPPLSNELFNANNRKNFPTCTELFSKIGWQNSQGTNGIPTMQPGSNNPSLSIRYCTISSDQIETLDCTYDKATTKADLYGKRHTTQLNKTQPLDKDQIIKDNACNIVLDKSP
jgi:hypothetical protein